MISVLFSCKQSLERNEESLPIEPWYAQLVQEKERLTWPTVYEQLNLPHLQRHVLSSTDIFREAHASNYRLCVHCHVLKQMNMQEVLCDLAHQGCFLSIYKSQGGAAEEHLLWLQAQSYQISKLQCCRCRRRTAQLSWCQWCCTQSRNQQSP